MIWRLFYYVVATISSIRTIIAKKCVFSAWSFYSFSILNDQFYLLHFPHAWILTHTYILTSKLRHIAQRHSRSGWRCQHSPQVRLWVWWGHSRRRSGLSKYCICNKINIHINQYFQLSWTYWPGFSLNKEWNLGRVNSFSMLFLLGSHVQINGDLCS